MDSSDSPKTARFITLRAKVLFLLLVAAFGAYFRFVYLPGQNAQTANNSVYDVRLQNLDTTIMLHEKRLEKLEEEIQKLSISTPLITAMLPPAPATTQTPSTAPANAEDARVTALEKEMAALKSIETTRNNDQIYQAIRLLSTFHHFSEKVLSGKPFATELAAFSDQIGENDSVTKALSVLAPYAENGVPSFAQLLTSFDVALEQVNTMEGMPPPGATLWQRFVYNIKHLVRIRRLNEEQAGNSIDSIISRASAHLDRQEIEAAQTEIKSLPDNARGAFAGWLEDAQANSDAPGLIDQIEEQVMQKAFHTEAAAMPLMKEK